MIFSSVASSAEKAARTIGAFIMHAGASLVFCWAEFGWLFYLQGARVLIAVSASARDLKIASLATVMLGVSVRGNLSATVHLLVRELSTT
jgi:hypothetical protein